MLLLRLGEVELAERVWSSWTETHRQDAPFDEESRVTEQDVKDAYVASADCWVSALIDRARAAHLRADDRLAPTSAEMLARVGPATKAEVQRRGFSAARLKDSMLSDDFHCGGILADQRRRAR